MYMSVKVIIISTILKAQYYFYNTLTLILGTIIITEAASHPFDHH